MDCGRGHWGAPGEAGGAAGPNWLMGAPGVEGVLTGSLVREETGATSVGALLLLLLLLLLLFTVLLCWLLLLLLLLFTTTCKAPSCQWCAVVAQLVVHHYLAFPNVGPYNNPFLPIVYSKICKL